MSTALTLLLGLLAFALASTRPTTAQARTCAEMRATLQRAGWPRVTARTLQVAVVLTLLLLATVCRLLWHTAYGVGSVLAVVAVGLATLGGGPELRAGGAA
ncbi:hypothetical protein OG884_15385 [Streptosporangium sp. NBC_01755]|uniref:hypothetical protein n=1 Tax=unclassified Streptosporangium TaxID=2632669 RepID=UPI002DD86ADD|nr:MULTISPECIES: hypothetical protein [unclassified Streptosporangium]WSA27391.1 hypothetical protein OIE13_05825 [Streptosporangium sp. NBC_01810]WSD03216.1 hypothetical protein OG884_15385 [Streptosporangium sp. NBC_01755]